MSQPSLYYPKWCEDAAVEFLTLLWEKITKAVDPAMLPVLQGKLGGNKPVLATIIAKHAPPASSAATRQSPPPALPSPQPLPPAPKPAQTVQISADSPPIVQPPDPPASHPAPDDAVSAEAVRAIVASGPVRHSSVAAQLSVSVEAVKAAIASENSGLVIVGAGWVKLSA